MKATMDALGVITLQAETSVEAFALKHWCDGALVQVDDTLQDEQCYWRGSKLMVIATSATQQEAGK